MLLVLHAIGVAAIWATALRESPVTAAFFLSAAVWVAFRALSFRSATPVAIGITVGATILLMATSASGFVRVPDVGFGVQKLSVLILLVLLAVVAWVDLTDFHRRKIVDEGARAAVNKFVRRHGIRILWMGVAGFIAIYALLLPLVAEWRFRQLPPPENPLQVMDRLTLQQSVLFNLCESVTAIFFFVIGACVGSFLNVVIYRVPLGISVLVKPSHCPGCDEKISGRDNLPIVGWLKLKGCCRNCGIGISSRYPTVELVVGLVFLILYFVQLISGGTNLPGRNPNQYAGVLWILFYTKWDLVGLYFYHCLLMCTLFSWAMIQRDGQRVPVRVIALMFVLLASPPLLSPHLLPYPAVGAGLSGVVRSYEAAETAVTMGVGLAAGFCLAFLYRLFSRFAGQSTIPDHVASWMLFGMALGWQAVLFVFVLMLVWHLLMFVHRCVFDVHPERPKFALVNVHLVLPWVVFIHHCVWRSLVYAVT